MSYHEFCEQYAARCAEQRAEEEQFQRTMDASRATIRQRSGAPDLVFKTHQNETPPPREPAQDMNVMFHAIAEALALARIEMREEMRKYVDKKFADVVKSNVEPLRKSNVA